MMAWNDLWRQRGHVTVCLLACVLLLRHRYAAAAALMFIALPPVSDRQISDRQSHDRTFI
tara:strand:- start:165 stop:344 length:180 start_codon:yes stop_codon:yes gene_type:complete